MSSQAILPFWATSRKMRLGLGSEIAINEKFVYGPFVLWM